MKKLIYIFFVFFAYSCGSSDSEVAKRNVHETSIEVNQNVMSTKGELLVVYYPKDEELLTKFRDSPDTFDDFEQWFNDVAIKVAKERDLEITKSSEDNIMVEISPGERFTLYRPGSPSPYGIFIIKSGTTPIAIQGLSSAEEISHKLDSLNGVKVNK